MKITKAKYNWLVAQYNYRKNKEQLIEISDKEYERLTGEIILQGPTGNTSPVEPTPNSGIPIHDEEDSNKINEDNEHTYLTIEAIENGKLTINVNNRIYPTYIDNNGNASGGIPSYIDICLIINEVHTNYSYNSNYSYEDNIYEINIYKNDKIKFNIGYYGNGRYFSKYDLNYIFNFNFNYKIYGNVITIIPSFYNDFINYDKFNYDNIRNSSIYVDYHCVNINVYNKLNQNVYLYYIKNNDTYFILDENNITLQQLYDESYFTGGEWSGYIYSFKLCRYADNTNIFIVKNKNYNWDLTSFIDKNGDNIYLPDYVNIIEYDPNTLILNNLE